MPLKRSQCVFSFLNIASKRFFTNATLSEIKLSNQAVTKKRNALFTEERNRQASLITRVEKIQVRYTGVPEKCTLIMNKQLSTPYDCARHINENLCQLAVVAMVNGKVYDMHRALTEDCELNFKFYKDEDPYLPNKAFWRTGSFVLGYLAERAFKDQFFVRLHSWPQPQVRSGSFVYDIDLGIENWTPRMDELNVLTSMGRKLINQDPCFECIDVDASVALKIFEDNRYKVEQLPRIAAESSSGSTVTLYRLFDHVDISRGPMVGRLNHLQCFKVLAVHPIETSAGLMYRFQGLAIPRDFTISSFALDVIWERARRMNYTGLPRQKVDEEEEGSALQEGTENDHHVTFKKFVA